MRLSQPKKNVFNITLIAGALGLIVFIVSFFAFAPAFVGIIAFVLMLCAFGLLAAACAFKGI